MANSIRKGSYVAAGSVSGRVAAVSGDVLTLESGETVSKADAVKLTAADYKALSTSPADVEVVKVSAKKPAKATKTTSAKRPGKKGTGKKAHALKIFNGNPAITRKQFTEKMAKHGLSAAGSSTYYYNIKNGIWA